MADKWLGWRRRRDPQRWGRKDEVISHPGEVAVGRLVRLREKRQDDAAADYAWRRDAELSSFDAVSPITISFEDFLRDYKYELASIGGRRRRFAIETIGGLHIGNCSLFNVDDRRRQAELGIMIGDKDYWSQGYGEDTVRTLVTYAFEQLPVDRVYLYTLDWNVRAQKSFKKSGFRENARVSDDRNKFVVMDLFRKDFMPDLGSPLPESSANP